MRIWSKFGLSVVCLAGVLAGTAARAERLPIRQYTTADGLAHDRVERILRDSRGFLWFATSHGLSRFDGHTFKTYGPEHGLLPGGVEDLVEGPGGIYWVATWGGGVYRFDSRSPDSDRPFTSYPVGDGPATNKVHALELGKNGRLWAGTLQGLFALDLSDESPRFRRVEPGMRDGEVPEPRIWRLYEDTRGTLWLATEVGLWRRSPDGRVVFRPVVTSHDSVQAYSVVKDRDGRIWVAHTLGVTSFRPASPPETGAGGSAAAGAWFSPPRNVSIEERRGPPDEPGESTWYTPFGLHEGVTGEASQSPDGRILVGSRGRGLAEFDGERFRIYPPSSGFEGAMGSAAADTAGNLWVSTFDRGVLRVAGDGFTAFDRSDGLEDARYLGVALDWNGRVVAVAETVLCFFDGSRFAPVRPPVPREERFTALPDHRGEWWVGTSSALYRFPRADRPQDLARADPVAVYTDRDGLPPGRILVLFEDSRGDLWIGLDARDGVARWERATGKFHRYSEADGLPPSRPPGSFAEDRAGNVWIAIWGGLARYRDGAFRVFTGEDGLPEYTVSTLFTDSRGRLWILPSAAGLLRVDDPTRPLPVFVRYTTADGLSSNHSSCATEDLWGRIYVGSRAGVDQLDLETGAVRHYTTADGLNNNEVISAVRDREGALWFLAWVGGVSRLVPRPDPPALALPPPIYVHQVRVAGARQPVAEIGAVEISGLRLRPRENHVEILFGGIFFESGGPLRYQYRLEGAGKEWSEPTEHTSVTYAKLAPGRYRFLVRAVSPAGAASERPAVVSFRILPPVWQRGWFLSLAALTLATAVYGAHRYRLTRVVEMERVRTRIATDIHDDIGSSLSQISIMSEVAKREVGEAAQHPAKLLTEIGETARGLADAAADIVWSVDPRQDDLGSLVARLRKFASDVLEGGGIAWGLESPSEPEKVKLTPEARRHLFLILKEAVTNVVRHAEASRVSISIRVPDRAIVAEVRDDGRGFDRTAAGQRGEDEGHGLGNMSSRAEAAGGQLEIVSAAGQGTRITVTMPLARHQTA